MALAHDTLQQLLLPNGGGLAVDSMEAAYKRCKDIAQEHYENFPVGSLLIDREHRPAFFVLYVFSRLVDDIADELDADARTKMSHFLAVRKHLASTEPGTHPLYRALRDVRRRFDIPQSTLERLIQAFESDAAFERPTDWDALLGYCDLSANPVGELILRLYQNCDAQSLHYSNCICTSLQLINFWQDFSRDIPHSRYYIPQDLLANAGLDPQSLDYDRNSPKFRSSMGRVLCELFTKSRSLMDEGSALIGLIRSRRLALELCLVIEGGYKILSKLEALQVRCLDTRPALRRMDYGTLVFKAISRFLRRRSH